MEFAVRLWIAILDGSKNPVRAIGAWITIGGPIATFIATSVLSVRLAQPAAFLTVMALLFGGYLSAFVHYSTLRLRLTETQEQFENAEDPERRLVDSVAALLLVGATSAVIAAGYLAVAISVVDNPPGVSGLCGYAASFGWTFASLPAFIFIYTAPLLFRGYQQIVATKTGPRFV